MKKLRIHGFFAFAVVLVAIPTYAQTFSVLYNFGTHSEDPVNPQNPGIVAQGRDGNLYSTAPSGGANGGGAVFRITPTGHVTVLHSFDTMTQDSGAFSGLTLGRDGNFYGTTRQGGTNGFGTVFKITPSGQLTVLYNFAGGSDGAGPSAAPVQGTDGNFYGTTAGPPGAGTVYRITSSGKLTTLHQFNSGASDGISPVAPLLQGTDGNFYGTTLQGGSGSGVVFKMTPSGKLTILHSFGLQGTDGEFPDAPLIQGSDGSFYGTTQDGIGGTNFGIVFRITASGTLTVLHKFNGTDGSSLFGGLMQATDGNLYGVAAGGGPWNAGTLFRITPKGVFSVLHNFDGTTSGGPEVTLLQHTSGVLYGDTSGGGTQGTFYGLNVGLHPFVVLLSTSGKAGQVVEVLGNGLTGTTSVKFGAGSASFTVVSDTYMTAVVPATGTTGAVTVTSPSGIRVSSKNFRVQPVISSFSPTSGPVGTQVVIKGTGLTQATKVTFGGVAATSLTVNSATQATAIVPTGSKTGQIAITTPGGTAKSFTNFTVTP